MMDIYTRKSRWKWYLAAAGVAIVIISLLYTRYLADQLVERENQQAAQFAEAMRQISRLDQSLNCDLTLPTRVIADNNTIPVIVLDETRRIEMYRNIGSSDSLSPQDLQKALARMVEEGADTILVSLPPDIDKLVIYSHSNLLALLRLYPYVQLFLIATFITFGYLAFSAARRAEENLVWLGMAKETAHQLGTPITAILGWIEALKANNEDNPANLEMLTELQNDVNRLELIADRFSKIGSQPELHPVNLYAELAACRDYMRRRAPRKVTLDFPDPAQHEPLTVHINPPLFDWVMENLLRNAIDAMEGGAGVISVVVRKEPHAVCIDVSDTGKGIPSSKFQTIFKPGYSTKTRGWGLGLSLSKRIIERYHGGKIFVKSSELGKGSTFTIRLPLYQHLPLA
ncbi:MAG: HAMP domain-containing sensor histidine kinase [Saprospiraceae bacterium]|nr:HAMP domain-containing histidine kinase [Saprospiraceae bacterium]MDW8229508.1 HAMP domain-containing sensor histidine kinase [Saprospiraceae bacterium]